MTSTAPPPTAPSYRADGSTTPKRIWAAKFLDAGQLLIALAATIAALIYLMRPQVPPEPTSEQQRRPAEVVQVLGPRLVRVQPGSKLEKKLEITAATSADVTTPVLTVTGTVVASLRQGNGHGHDYWQFNSPEILTAYSDWQKSLSDIAFAQTQLSQISELNNTRIETQQKVVNRLEKVVAEAGTVPQKDLDAERASLLQFKIQGRKEIYEAETAVRVATKNEATLARQLEQAGLEKSLLQSATNDMDIVMADVPEGVLTRVKIGQSCTSKFFGIPDDVFPGKVNSISPVISKERRTLRVLFIIKDPKDLIHAGMFGEIGLGTDPRPTLLMPAEGVLHIGKADYVLAASTGEPGAWRVAEVQVGEPHGNQVEAIGGIRPGEHVIGRGAILLKPAVVKALLAAKTDAAAGAGR